MSPDTSTIRSFYDQHAPRQVAAAFNERHAFLYSRLRRLGLQARSRVLELGCGVGAITSLVATTVTAGRIVAVDLSPASVDLARARLTGRAGVELLVGDVVTFRANETFDFVTLFDVLEHVPPERHPLLFDGLAAHMGEDTVLAINIPNPAYLEYLRVHDPESLQVVDLPVWADHIMALAYPRGLVLDAFETYGVWIREDYQFMTFRRKRTFANVACPAPPAWRRAADRVGSSMRRATRRMLHAFGRGRNR